MYDSRFAAPPEMQLVSGSASEAAAALLQLTEESVAGAQLPFSGDDGNYWLFAGEAVTVIDKNATTEHGIRRPNWHEDAFLLEHPDGSETPLDLSADGTKLSGEGLSHLRKLVQGIGKGALRGEHTVVAVKFLDRGEEEDMSPLVVRAAVSRSSDGRGRSHVTTAADLCYMRTYDFDSHLYQTHHITYDARTGLYRVGDDLRGDSFVEVPDTYDPETGEFDERLVEDPMPQHTADVQQYRYDPLTPVNRPLDDREWRTVVYSNITPRDRLQPRDL
ncbi:MAG TPA: hypothetical protein VF466_03500 [Candidatus Saccharimonadales bacterium]